MNVVLRLIREKIYSSKEIDVCVEISIVPSKYNPDVVDHAATHHPVSLHELYLGSIEILVGCPVAVKQSGLSESSNTNHFNARKVQLKACLGTRVRLASSLTTHIPPFDHLHARMHLAMSLNFPTLED